jgi:hypothetical protein
VLEFATSEPLPATYASQPTVSRQVIVAKVCTRGEVETLVKTFIRAFNDGELERLDRIFARKPEFRSYATDPPGRRHAPSAWDRATLIRYFAQRHALGERLQLRSLRFTGNTVAVPPWGNFSVELLRSARNLPPTRYRGTGAAYCYAARSNAIIVWSMSARK